jgi:ADP-Ribosyltransferase in polyvalent proteins
MRYSQLIEAVITNPFRSSKLQEPLYHGSHYDIEHFYRTHAGIWFADYPKWARDHYAGDNGFVYECFVDVRNPYFPTEKEIDAYYGKMDLVPGFFEKLENAGYDAYMQGGESGSIAVFRTVPILNIQTGKLM